ncbi:unnamed protein product, partial [Ixodes hexagonus]
GSVPCDSPDASSQPGQVKTEAGQDPSEAREEHKPDVARVGPEKPPPDSRPPEPTPTKASQEPKTPVDHDVAKRQGEGAPEAPARPPLTKKPSKLETAKEDVLGVFESMKKNVGAAKEAFFERPAKAEQPKPASPKAAEPKTPDVPEAKKTEEDRGKTESFLQKFRFGKSESKEKSSPEAVSGLAEAEKQPSGTSVPPLVEYASVLAETPMLLKETTQSAGKTSVQLVAQQSHSATVSLKQTSQGIFDAGHAEAESLKQKSQHALDAGIAQAEYLKQKSQEVVDAGKVQAESLKQKSQEVVDAGKAQVESLERKSEQSLETGKVQAESLKQQVLDASKAQVESLRQKSAEVLDAGKVQAEWLKQKTYDVGEAGRAKAEDLKQKSQDTIDSVKGNLDFLHKKSLQAAEATKEKAEDLKQKSQDAVDVGRSQAASSFQQVQSSVLTAADQVKVKSQTALDAGKQQVQAIDQKSRGAVDAGKAKVEDFMQSAQETVEASKTKVLETADHAKEKAHETTDATKAKAEDIKRKAQDALNAEKLKAEQVLQDAVVAGKTKADAITETSVETLDAAKVKVGAFVEELRPTVAAVPDCAKQVPHEAVDVEKFGDETAALQDVTKDAAATSELTTESLTDKAKETYDTGKRKADSFLQQVKPAVVGASDTVKQRSQEAFDAGKSMAESYAQQVKAFMFDEPDPAKELPVVRDASANKKGAEEEPRGTLLDQVKLTALSTQAALGLASHDPLGLEDKEKATKGASRIEVLGSAVADEFQLAQEKSLDALDSGKGAAESLKTNSQETFDLAKSKAEQLVEHVISSVVGASESLKHASEDAFGSDKDKIEFLKQKAQQEFEFGESKAHTDHAHQEVSSAARLACQEASGAAEEPKSFERLLDVEQQGDRRSLSPRLEDIETAVVKIQAGVRGYLTRKNLHERSPQPQHDDSEYDTAGVDQSEASADSNPSSTAVAATKIQAAFRGYRVRKELKPDNGPSGLHKEDRELVESR